MRDTARSVLACLTLAGAGSHAVGLSQGRVSRLSHARSAVRLNEAAPDSALGRRQALAAAALFAIPASGSAYDTIEGALANLEGGAPEAVPVVPIDDSLRVYFGAGCFWHMQHEMVREEIKSLGRDGSEITAVSGFAGGKNLGPEGRVCYHNRRNIADYGLLGHAEAVQVPGLTLTLTLSPATLIPHPDPQVTIPPKKLKAFAKKYFKMFGERGFRHDPQVPLPACRRARVAPRPISSSTPPRRMRAASIAPC